MPFSPVCYIYTSVYIHLYIFTHKFTCKSIHGANATLLISLSKGNNYWYMYNWNFEITGNEEDTHNGQMINDRSHMTMR